MILLLTLPFAVAQSLRIDRFSGRAGAENFVAARQDMLIAEVTVSVPGNPTPEAVAQRVRIKFSTVESFFNPKDRI